MFDGVDATEHVHGLDSGLLHDTPLQREEPAVLPHWPGCSPHTSGSLGAMVNRKLEECLGEKVVCDL